jgi:hypothetical protein
VTVVGVVGVDDQLGSAFAPLDDLIDEAEKRDAGLPWPVLAGDSATRPEDEAIEGALDDFFNAPATGRSERPGHQVGVVRPDRVL